MAIAYNQTTGSRSRLREPPKPELEQHFLGLSDALHGHGGLAVLLPQEQLRRPIGGRGHASAARGLCAVRCGLPCKV